MRIAQIAPLIESVPPQYYGGSERVVSWLTEELVKQGHEVTLFASGDSTTTAKLVAACPRSLRLDESCIDKLSHHMLMLENAFQKAAEFDVMHFHTDYLHFSLLRRYRVPSVTTLHGRLDLVDVKPLFEEFREIPVVSISNAQRLPVPRLNWRNTVYHGLPADLYTLQETPGDYLLFLGRICPEKRVDRAIEIAKRAGMPLKIAAKVDPADRQYYKEQIKPLLTHPLIEYIGEVAENSKNELIGNAYALLFPIDWPEPFGLVMIEAMACGTPVIAFCHGSVPEIIKDNVTGFVCTNIDQAVAAVGSVGKLSRKMCRLFFEKYFTASQMAANYVAIYEQRVLDSKLRQLPKLSAEEELEMS